MGKFRTEVPIHSQCWMGVVHMEKFRHSVTTAVHTQALKAASGAARKLGPILVLKDASHRNAFKIRDWFGFVPKELCRMLSSYWNVQFEILVTCSCFRVASSSGRVITSPRQFNFLGRFDGIHNSHHHAVELKPCSLHGSEHYHH